MARNWFHSLRARPDTRTTRNVPTYSRGTPWRRSQLPLRFHLESLEDRSVPATIGYYDLGWWQGNPSQETAIVAAGHTPVMMFDLTPAELAGIDVLDVQNPFGDPTEYLDHLPGIEAAVTAGMTLVIHDRNPDFGESLLPGGAGFDIITDFSDPENIDVLDDTTLVTNGPGGIVDDTTLDGGFFSTHGFAFAGSLPGSAAMILSTGDPIHIVTFAYGFGAGTVIYSSIPLDFYREFGFAPNFSDIYAPNVLAYAATNPLGGLSVTSTTPANGSVVSTTPTQYVVNVSNPLVPGTVDATDFQVNGIPADDVSYTPGTTSLTFTFASDPVTAQGLQTMHVAAGAFTRVSDGLGVREFNGTFRYDAVLMQVTSTAPAVGSTIILPATTLDLNFNEPYALSSAQASDFTVNQGTVSGVSQVDADTLRLTLTGVTVEGTLTVSMAAGAMTDLFGNPGAAFSGNYTLDKVSSPFPTPFNGIAPPGSLIYTGSHEAFVAPVGDTDTYSLTVDPGLTITVVVNPTDPALQPRVRLLAGTTGNSVAGTATAGAAGQPAVLQTVAVPGQIAGTGAPAQAYRIVIEGAGGTTGAYSFDVHLNSAVESESNGGAANDTRATAQNIGGSFVQLHSAGNSGAQPARGAVLGTIDSAPGADPIAEVEPNDSLTTAQSLDGATFTVAGDPFITDSTTIPHVSINGDGNGTYDYYSFTVDAGDHGIFDIDFENYDSWLELYDSAGNFLTSSDDNGGDPGSGSGFASYIDYTFGAAGTYSIVVASFPGSPVFSGAVYTLHVSLSGKPYVPPGPDVYSVSLRAGASHSFVADGVSVELQNAAGDTVATGAALNNFVAPATGTYYAVVSGLPGTDYSLVVTQNADFDRGGNDDTASAQPVVGTQVAGRQWELGYAQSGTIDHSDGFADSRGLVANGSASFTGGVARLTDGGFDEAGSFFTRDTVSVASFDTSFTFQMLPGTFPMADGMTFTIQGAGSTALGATGSSLGYEGIPSSVAVKFDNWNNEDGGFPASETGLYTGGEYPGHPAVDLLPSGIDLTSGNLFHVAMHYDGTVLSVTITDTVTLASATQTYAVDIPALVGGSEAYVGFTGGTGGLSAVQDVLSWSFQSAPKSDFYQVTLAAGQPLEVETATPGGGAGAFENLLDPVIRVYNSAGVLVASDDNSAGDGRNARVKYNVPKGKGGVYYIEVASSSATPALTAGEYILSVKGNTAGSAQYVGAAAGTAADDLPPLTDADLRRAFDHALDYWAAQGVDTTPARGAELRIDDMVDGMLGYAFEDSGVIVIDDDAGGRGWSFGPNGVPGTVDLYETVTHEVGHLLGFEHTDDHDVMAPTLAPIAGVPAAVAPVTGVLTTAPEDVAMFGPNVDAVATAPAVAGPAAGFLPPTDPPALQEETWPAFLPPAGDEAAPQPDGPASQDGARPNRRVGVAAPSERSGMTAVAGTTYPGDPGLDEFNP